MMTSAQREAVVKRYDHILYQNKGPPFLAGIQELCYQAGCKEEFEI